MLIALNAWQFTLRRIETSAPDILLPPRRAARIASAQWTAAGDTHHLPPQYGLGNEEQARIDAFHALFYKSHDITWHGSRWLGVDCQQNPNDVWITQEILYEVKPDLVIETDTFRGGSAVLWSSLLELINPSARVITIDIEDQSAAARQHPLFQRRVTFIKGSSTAPDVVARVKELARGRKTLVILDSDHSADDVLAELRAYSELVGPGSYIIVQDTNVNGHPVAPTHGPGPMEAVQQFLQETNAFVPDRSRERFLFTMHPRGYLKRQQ